MELPDGTYNWSIRAIDIGGHIQESGNRSLTIDIHKPALNIISPDNNSINTSTRAIIFRYNTTDETLKNASLIINGIINLTNVSLSNNINAVENFCLLYTSPSPRD